MPRSRRSRPVDNAYTVTQGIPELRTKIQAAVDAEFRHADRQVLITAGTSGALLLAICCVVDPGDEVIVFDPCFMMYKHLATLAGGRTGPGRHLSGLPDRCRHRSKRRSLRAPSASWSIARSIRPAIVATADEMRALAELCRRRDVLLDQRRGLPSVLLRSPLRHAGKLERRRPRRRRLQQVARHDRLAAGFCPWPEPLDPGNGQASAIQLRLCAEHGPVRRCRRPGRGPDVPDRGVSPQARHGRRRLARRLRAGPSRRCVLRLPARPLGHAAPSSWPRRSRTTC